MSREKLYSEIEAALVKSPEGRHSYFQMKYFVIGKEPTHQAKMWQCLREIEARKSAIDSLNMAVEEVTDQLEVADIEWEKAVHDDQVNCSYPQKIREREMAVKERQYERRVRQLKNSMSKLAEELKFAWEEAEFFLKIFNELQDVEPLRSYDDAAAQEEYWDEKTAQEINLKLLLNQPLDIELVQMVLALPASSAVRAQTEKTLALIQEQIKESNEKKIDESRQEICHRLP